MKVTLIDPANYGMYYNYCLSDELARKGCIVEILSSISVYEEILPPPNVKFTAFYFKNSNRIETLVRSDKVRRFARSFEYLFNLVSLMRHILSQKGNIIHFTWLIFPPIDYIMIKLFKYKGFPIVYTAHNALPHEPRSRHISQYKKIYNVVDHIICLTKLVKETLVNKLNVDQKKISVIAHGDYDFILNQVKSDQIIGSNIQKRKNKYFTILYFGQIRPYKGLSYFIKAIPYVIEKHPKCKFLILGKDMEGKKDHYLKMIHEMKLDNQVSCDFRYIPLSDLIAYLRLTDIVVLPYITASQSGNIPMLSKMGIPVIATWVGGLSEMIQEGRNGFLVPPRDEKAIAEAVCKLLGDPGLLAKMKRESVDYAKEAFSWENIVMRTIDIYERVLKTEGSRA